MRPFIGLQEVIIHNAYTFSQIANKSCKELSMFCIMNYWTTVNIIQYA